MYCPNCGSKNQEEIHYCTRCGANLAVVSEVMSGKLTSASGVDERMVTLLKAYYNGRRSTILGAAFLLAGLLVMTPLMATGAIDDIPILALFALGCLIYGAVCLVWGIGAWMDSSSEMKALEIAMPHKSLNTERAEQIGPAPVDGVISAAKNYSTDPISAPVSVTENTTHRLEEQATENEKVRR